VAGGPARAGPSCPLGSREGRAGAGLFGQGNAHAAERLRGGATERSQALPGIGRPDQAATRGGRRQAGVRRRPEHQAAWVGVAAALGAL